MGIGIAGLRSPGALLRSRTALGLEGVWWTISVSSILKGVILCLWYLYFMYIDSVMQSLRADSTGVDGIA